MTIETRAIVRGEDGIGPLEILIAADIRPLTSRKKRT
jgi:hypothetical protein